MLEEQTSNVSRLSRIVENNFNLCFFQKQPCFDSMLEIDSGSMRE
jgi:hypothetical protein